jgi:AraC-like DNA-binding protein
MNLNGILNIVILLGAIQGFITSILLCFSKNYRLTNRFLGLLIFLIALASINLYGNYVNWFNSSVLQFLTQLMPMVIIMPLGPLLYFYVQSFAEPNFKIDKTSKYHFYPVVIDLIPSFAILIYIIGVYAGLMQRNPKPWINFIDQFNVYSDVLRWLSLTVYVWLSSRYLSSLSLEATFISKAKLNWLKQFIRIFICFQLLWLCYLIPYVIPRYTNKMLETFGWYPIYIPLAILIYWLGIKGYLISHTQQIETKKIGDIKNVLTADKLLEISKALQVAMEVDELYLNPNLNLSMVAEYIHCSPKTISAVLNQHLKKSFNDFINEYRILAFKKKFTSSAFEHLTITGIALECGFNSQATFQRVFKESTGLSPSGFRKTMV